MLFAVKWEKLNSAKAEILTMEIFNLMGKNLFLMNLILN